MKNFQFHKLPFTIFPMFFCLLRYGCSYVAKIQFILCVVKKCFMFLKSHLCSEKVFYIIKNMSFVCIKSIFRIFLNILYVWFFSHIFENAKTLLCSENESTFLVLNLLWLYRLLELVVSKKLSILGNGLLYSKKSKIIQKFSRQCAVRN